MTTFPAELTGTWDIDPVHSTVGFAARHAMVATTRGHFTVFKGGATIDAENPSNSTLWVDIDADSVNTGNEQRDGHLRSGDFFHAEQHPHITFRSTSVKVDGDEIVTSGDLTVAGVTHPVEVTWEFNGVAKDPYGNLRSGFDGAGEPEPQGLGTGLERRAGDRRLPRLRQDQAGARDRGREAGRLSVRSSDASSVPSGDRALRRDHARRRRRVSSADTRRRLLAPVASCDRGPGAGSPVRSREQSSFGALTAQVAAEVRHGEGDPPALAAVDEPLLDQPVPCR